MSIYLAEDINFSAFSMLNDNILKELEITKLKDRLLISKVIKDMAAANVIVTTPNLEAVSERPVSILYYYNQENPRFKLFLIISGSRAEFCCDLRSQ